MLDAYFAFAFEKLWRLHGYLEEIANAPGRPGKTDILTNLNTSLRDIEDDLQGYAEYYLSISLRKLVPVDCRSILSNISLCIARFRELHDQLKYMFTPWPSPQLRELVSELIVERDHEAHEGPWVLIDDYTYWLDFYTVREDKDELEDQRQYKGPFPGYALPKCEKDNPLMWPIIVHELGHSLWDKADLEAVVREEILENKLLVQICEKYTGSISQGEKLDIPIFVLNWIEEFFSDFYALELMGPCFLPALLNLVCTRAPSRSFWHASSGHPPPRHRILAMFSYLDNRLAKMRASENPEHVAEAIALKSSLEVCREFFNYRLEFEHSEGLNSYSVPEQQIKSAYFSSDGDLSHYFNALTGIAYGQTTRKTIEKALGLSKTISFRLGSQMGELFSRLDRGIPIGALFDREQSSANHPDSNKNEKPMSIRTIINAGWLSRVMNQAQHWRDTLSTEPGDDGWAGYYRWLSQQDAMISASIDQAKVHGFIDELLSGAFR